MQLDWEAPAGSSVTGFEVLRRVVDPPPADPPPVGTSGAAGSRVYRSFGTLSALEVVASVSADTTEWVDRRHL